MSASPPDPAAVPQNAPSIKPSTARTRAGGGRLGLWLTIVTGVLLALLATVTLMAVQLHFEAHDRALLHSHLERARVLLARVDDTAALSQLPGELAAAFGDEHELAVRVQGPLGQALYEQAPAAAMPARLLQRPAVAPPVPLIDWTEAGHFWRGSALLMRLSMDGSAPLTVAMALDVGRDQAFVIRLRLVLAGYVLLATLGFALLAWWAARRARQ